LAEVAHVTRDSVTTFKVKRSKIKVTGAGHIPAAARPPTVYQIFYMRSANTFLL